MCTVLYKRKANPSICTIGENMVGLGEILFEETGMVVVGAG